MGAFPRWPPKAKELFLQHPLAFKPRLPSRARFCHQARRSPHHTAVGHMENPDPQVISTLQLPFSSARSSTKVANKLWQFLFSLLNPSGREKKQCPIKRPGEEKAEGWNWGKVQPCQSLASPESSWTSKLWSQDFTPCPRNALLPLLLHPIPPWVLKAQVKALYLLE